jgi:hypothetical protein
MHARPACKPGVRVIEGRLQSRRLWEISMDEKTEPAYFGQLIFFTLLEKHDGDRRLMARIALNMAGFGSDYPVALDSMLRELPWEHMQATIQFIALQMNCRIVWSDAKLARLVEWAA